MEDYEKYIDNPLEIKACADLNELLDQELWDLDELEIIGQDIPAAIVIEDGKVIKLSITGHFLGDSLPDSIGNLVHLKVAWLDWIYFKKFPKSMKNLTNLEDLILNGCRLSIFPDFIYSLSKLERLMFNKNQIEHIQESIENLKSLKYLYLKDNKLEYLPYSIVNIKSLKKLFLVGNKKELILRNSHDIIEKLQNQGCTVGI